MTDDIRIRRARPEEAAAITALALRSKAHWGYSDTFLDAVRAELTYTPADCASGDLFVAQRDGSLLGFHRLDGSPPHGELASLFVDPPFIGQGVGAQLLRHALSTATKHGFVTLTVDADPDAEPFRRARSRRPTAGPVDRVPRLRSVTRSRF